MTGDECIKAMARKYADRACHADDVWEHCSPESKAVAIENATFAYDAMAEACNGGTWETHYVEAQRDVWRKRIDEMV